MLINDLDGEWTSVIIDDKLYLREPDYEFADRVTRATWEENRIRVNSEEEYRKEFQSNSRSLYYAQSAHPDETWVPLIEKAFAKAHGDYGAISGGSVGEGVEDLTGGVSTTIIPTDILSKDRFWNESILKVNEEYLIGCGTTNWDDPLKEGRDGIHGGHAYSVLRAVNYGKERLMLLKNPWGEQEWNGPWFVTRPITMVFTEFIIGVTALGNGLPNLLRNLGIPLETTAYSGYNMRMCLRSMTLFGEPGCSVKTGKSLNNGLAWPCPGMGPSRTQNLRLQSPKRLRPSSSCQNLTSGISKASLDNTTSSCHSACIMQVRKTISCEHLEGKHGTDLQAAN